MLPPKGHKLVPRSTPLHVYQLLMLLLKETFSGLGDPYNAVDFDITYNKESLKLGKKPLIVCGCGDIAHQNIALQDLATANIKTFNMGKTAMVASSFVVKVISPNKTEVEILSNEVLNYLIAARTFLPHFTTIHHIDSITCTQVNKVYRDLPQYYTQCSLSYVMQYLWTHIIEQIPLKAVETWIYPI